MTRIPAAPILALSLVLSGSLAYGQVKPIPAADLPAEPVPVAQPAEENTPTAKEDNPAPTKDATEAKGDTPSDLLKDWKKNLYGSTSCVPEFIGDQAPIGSLRSLPSGQLGGNGAIFVPSVRYFKISDNESPQPQTRSYFSFNFFYDINGPVNQALGGGIQHTRIHREIWGVEWADKDCTSSFGMRLPLTTFNAANTVPGLDGTSTDLGDLALIWKNAVWQDHDTGSLISAGLAVIPPTAPGSFAGANNLKVFHNTCLQPFCGWIWSQDRFYLQGFTAVDAPTDLNDVVMLSNDFAVGYFLLQQGKDNVLTAVVPTLEIHVTTPLNHRGVMSLTDPAGNPDMVDVTAGVNFECGDQSTVIGFAMPVTGPRMFDFEILFQHRCRF